MNPNLNPEQKKAVESTEGRVLVLAGAGSGKTKVIVHRIAYLIAQKNVAPQAILGLTFTNKAAEEMRYRLKELIPGEQAEKVLLCTFHSFCMQVLRKEIHQLGYTRQFSLYDEKDMRRLLNQLVRDELKVNKELPSIDSIHELISHAKNRGEVPKTLSKKNPKWIESFTEELFKKLETSMRAYNAVDFDSLLTLTLELFQRFPDILARYQQQFRYVMIDEYQDTNTIQDRLAHLLTAQSGNLCVVGDDDQSIYSWRGADIQKILQFKADHLIKLEQNYRCTSAILHAANALIKHNHHRHQKTLFTQKSHQEPLVLFHAPTDSEEAQAVIQRMIWLKKEKNLQWGDMAILYRSNILSRPFEMALMQASWQSKEGWMRGIPYQVFGGLELYERSEIKDLIAYLRVIVNPLDQEALLRIINVPRRGISEKTLDYLTTLNRHQKKPLWQVLKHLTPSPELTEKAYRAINQFVLLIEEAQRAFKTAPLHKKLDEFLTRIDFKKTIDEDVKSEKAQQFKWENVLSFIQALEGYEQKMEKGGQKEEISLHDFITQAALDQNQINRKEKLLKEGAVNLMTFHSAKGLEFEACFLIGLEDHLIPHEKSLKEQSLEEERRLFYVALTRAKHYLTLSMARKRKRGANEESSNPSRFLFEIPKELFKVASWKTPF